MEQLEQDTFVGTVEMSWRGAYVVVDHRRLRTDVFVPDERLNHARNGQRVVVHITAWKRWKRYPEGEVVEVLGESGDNDAEMHAILAEFGLPYRYPAEAVAEAGQLEPGIEKEVVRRKDMRDVTTFTIDPADAKDFDDALSLRCLPDGSSSTDSTDSTNSTNSSDSVYEVGVHIADVTHYVRPDTLLDCEAFSRGTSVYLVDRTIPMLPERLSNGICSLRPGEDKLCFSVLFRLNGNAEVLKYDIKKTVIRSDRRFSYDEVQQRLDIGSGDYAAELQTLSRLAQTLRRRRMEKGAIDFERQEVRFRLDDAGKPLSVYFTEATPAHQLIEEFMLLANRTVAEHIGRVGQGGKPARTFVYRVHDVPDPDRMKDFTSFIRRFGYNLKPSVRKETAARRMNSLLEQVKGTPEQSLVETLAVRAMAKAVYSTDNIGHYGLAFPYYTHFTSPIRRYPDMMVHRLLERYLKGSASVGRDEYEERCVHCSDRERLAADAERASVKYKQVEFMQSQQGRVFEGVISNVTEWGLYVELLENHCEGLVPLRELGRDEYFVFNEKEFCVEGLSSGTRYTLGDHLRVRVSKTDLQRRQLDFALA